MKVHLPSCGICVDEGVNAAQQVYGRALNACCEVCGSVYRISFRCDPYEERGNELA